MNHAVPADVVALLADIAEDASHRTYRMRALAPEAGAATGHLDDALRSPALLVRAETLAEDPGEICVLAYGRDHMGRVWPSTPILVLDPAWDRDADKAQALADDVVLLWDRIRTAAARIAA